MYKKLTTKVIWVDFKTKRIFDLANFGHSQQPTKSIPWLCQKARIKEKINGKIKYEIFFYLQRIYE